MPPPDWSSIQEGKGGQTSRYRAERRGGLSEIIPETLTGEKSRKYCSTTNSSSTAVI